MSRGRRFTATTVLATIAVAMLVGCSGPTPSAKGCSPASDAMIGAIAERLNVEGQLRYGTVRPAPTGVIVSAELHAAGDDEDENGDILTWAAPSPDAKEFAAVDANAREKSAWPGASFQVRSNGSIESRGCTVAERREAKASS